MEIKKFLLQSKKLDKIVENKIAEKETLEHNLSSTGYRAIRYGDKVQQSPVDQTNRIVEIIDLIKKKEKEICQAIDDYSRHQEEVNRIIEQLPTEMYDVLHKMYLGERNKDSGITRYYDLLDIADLYQKSYSWANQTHINALRQAQRIMDKER